MKNYATRGTARGFSLIEIIVVVAILGIFLALVGPRIYRTFMATTVSKELTSLKDVMSSAMAYRDSGGLGNSGTNVVPLLQSSEDLPGSWRMVGTVPYSAWNQAVTVTSNGLGIVVSYAGVPKADCIKFATKGSSPDLTTSINGGSSTTGQMTATTANSGCTGATNTVAFAQAN